MKDTRTPSQKSMAKYYETLEASLKELTSLIITLDMRVTRLEQRPRTGYGRPQ